MHGVRLRAGFCYEAIRTLESNGVARGFLPSSSGKMPVYEWNFSDVNPSVHSRATLFLHRMQHLRVVRWDPGRHALRREAGAAGEPVSFREGLYGITGYNAHLTMTFKPSASRGNTTGVEGSERRRRCRRYTQFPARH